MIQTTYENKDYLIKTAWEDVSLADYIRLSEADSWESRFVALNPGSEVLWLWDSDWCLGTMLFIAEDPINNYLNPEGVGLPSVAESKVKKYWDSLVEIESGIGQNNFSVGARVYASYMEMEEEEVLKLPVTQVYGAIAFFLRILSGLISASMPLKRHRMRMSMRS